jgi:hypothetical protein
MKIISLIYMDKFFLNILPANAVTPLCNKAVSPLYRPRISDVAAAAQQKVAWRNRLQTCMVFDDGRMP